VAIFGGAVWLLRPLVLALAERAKGRSVAAAPGLSEDVLQELQAMRQDIAELAERVDFAERLLAKQREPARLEPKEG
jgi:hypothetical protein